LRGRFISFEGGEGVGKTSLMGGLREELAVRGLTVVTTREPGGTPQADRIRGLFAHEEHQDPWLPLTEAFLIAAARTQHVCHRIRPALAAGSWVLCDRFADSTRVYQAAVGQSALEQVISMATQGLEPDLTFLLDCPAEVSLARIHHRKNQGLSLESQDPVGRFDRQTVEVQEQRRRDFLRLAETFPARIVVLDAQQHPKAIVDQATAVLKSRHWFGG